MERERGETYKRKRRRRGREIAPILMSKFGRLWNKIRVKQRQENNRRQLVIKLAL